MASSSTRTIPAKGGDECDTFSRAYRRTHTAFGRPGVARRSKESYNRRARRLARFDARTQIGDA